MSEVFIGSGVIRPNRVVLNGGNVVPRGTLGNVWRHFEVSQLALVVEVRGLLTSYSVQHGPRDKELSSSKCQ